MAQAQLAVGIARATEKELTSRFIKLAQVLNNELNFRDQRLFFARTPSRTGSLFWRLENKIPSLASEYNLPGMVAQIAQAPNERAILACGFSEQWILFAKQYIFKSSNLRFMVKGTARDAMPISFRLEWAERELANDGKTWLYPGAGAAHPHWQFDSDLRALMEEKDGPSEVAQADAGEETTVVEIEVSEKVRDLTTALEEGVVGELAQKPDLSWFHKLHLPARAHWAERACVPPEDVLSQQHSPKTPEELDRWLLSALRYLRHEFNKYSA